MARSYQLTPRRRASILKAQKISATRRRGMIQKLLGAGVTKSVNAATLGGSGQLNKYLNPNSQYQVRRQAKLRRIKAQERPRYGNG